MVNFEGVTGMGAVARFDNQDVQPEWNRINESCKQCLKKDSFLVCE
jgi:hypothetical protein